MPLADLVGNADARRALERALALGRLPHALLFHGPPGIGKRALATALAEALLCPTGARPDLAVPGAAAASDACGTCNTCRRVREGIHPDFMTVEREGQFVKIDAIRKLAHESFLRPYEGRAKVFLLLEADRLTEDAANCLLKTLEEPPPSTYLVLVTSRREAVLPTLQSRCQSIELRPLARSELQSLLVATHGLDPDEADLRARLGEGSEASAMALDLDTFRALRGRLLDLVLPLASASLSPREADAITKLAEDAAKSQDAIELVLHRVLRSIARDALVRAAGGGAELAVSIDVLGPIDAVAKALGADGASALLADLDESEEDLRLNANKKLLVEAILTGIYARAARARPRPAVPSRGTRVRGRP